MNNRHMRTLQAVYATPVLSNVLWGDVEKLFRHLGARIKEGNGSRLAVELNGVRAYFHRPHPQKETDRGALVSARKFLENAGVYPC